MKDNNFLLVAGFFVVHLMSITLLVLGIRLHFRYPRFRILILVALCTMFIFNLMVAVFTITLYLIFTRGNLSAARRYWLLSITTYLFTIFNIVNAGLRNPIVRLHFFNYFLALPLAWLSNLQLFSGEYFSVLFRDFAVSQGMFWYVHLTGLLLLISLGYSYLLFWVVRIFEPRTPPPPPLTRFMMPGWLFFMGIVSFILFTIIGTEHGLVPVFGMIWPICMAFFALQGFCVIYKFLNLYERSRVYLFLIFNLSFFIHYVLWLVVILGALDKTFGLLPLLSRGNRPATIISERNLSLRDFVIAACIVSVALSATTYFISASMTPDKAPERFTTGDKIAPPARREKFRAEAGESEVRISGSGYSYFVDVYEYPNAPGEKPVATSSIDEARSLCEDAGKRLCKPDEWAIACSAGNHNKSYFLHRNEVESYTILKNTCDWDEHNDTASGAFPECVNSYGLHDMIGSLWEWVDLDAPEGTYAIMGPGEASGCQFCNNCNWHARIYEEQLQRIPDGIIGFRCCRDD